MKNFEIPVQIPNYINGQEMPATDKTHFKNINPHNGQVINKVARSKKEDVDLAIKSAKAFQKQWADTPAVIRGNILHDFANTMEEYQNDIAEIVTLETGKPLKDAMGETGGAIALARFFAGEGQRLYARTTTSGVENKYAMTIREPVGIAALIISANTPIANVAWKVFPALICGNGVVLKSSGDSPLASWIIGKISSMTDLPKGILNIVHGRGEEAGAALVEHKDIDVISFTGSTAVGKYIMRTAGPRLTKISLELGGKNPLVVCDDADLENAVKWTVLSAFSNAGQRCASGSRIIIFEKVYNQFKKNLIIKTEQLKLGITDNDDFGPVINEKQLNNMLEAIKSAKAKGAKILTGGKRLMDNKHKNGFYLAPTIIENVRSNDEISTTELFGPITCLYRVKTFQKALETANNSPYGLTASIHTKNVNRATEFARRVQAGAAVINGGTYGSEPHMPFGGVKQSGNGSREPGTEALDVYSNIKDIYQFTDTSNL